jgi:hypothetical protein
MLHSSRKILIKKDSLNFICQQADHKNFGFPTTKKSDRIHHTLLKRFEEVKEDSKQEDDQFAVVASTPPKVARPLPTLTPASSRFPFLDPTCQSTVTPPAVLPLRNNTTICQSTATPPVPIHNLQRDIDLVPANQNQQDCKRKYEETLLRLQDLEAKYTGLFDWHQTYLLKISSPIDLIAGLIDLPFVDGHKFDGSDVLKDSEKKQEQKVSGIEDLFIPGSDCQTSQLVIYRIESAGSSRKNTLEDM